jgi:hypothetical protein
LPPQDKLVKYWDADRFEYIASFPVRRDRKTETEIETAKDRETERQRDRQENGRREGVRCSKRDSNGLLCPCDRLSQGHHGEVWCCAVNAKGTVLVSTCWLD